MTLQPTTIQLSLVSHTNTGKTTLARSLIGRDVGEIRDEAHVTALAECHRMIESADGQVLNLWDTPGFGDSARLIKRLRLQGNPVGWLLSEVWDRWRDRPFWSSQQAIRNVREQADVVLYLVNASEKPGEAGYVAPEMEILAWIGKPVLVLLNQLGEPRPGNQDAADEALWRRHLTPYPFVRQILPLDAFARCWVQEGTLLSAVQGVLPPDRQPAMARLAEAWRASQRAVFDQSVDVLAQSLARTADTRMPLGGPAGTTAGLRLLASRLGARLGGSEALPDAGAQAQARLMAALDEDVRHSTAELIRLHGLQGRAEGEILARVAQMVAVNARIDEGRAALWGGVLSGALAGLKADLATGGLTMGGGLLAGGILGALGAAGVARGLNAMRGGGPAWVGWTAEALEPIVEAALLRYLAVAHFGRGRGDWSLGEAPPHWRPQVAEALQAEQVALAAIWAGRPTALDAPADAPRLAAALLPLLHRVLRRVIVRLYPEAAAMLDPVPGDAQ